MNIFQGPLINEVPEDVPVAVANKWVTLTHTGAVVAYLPDNTRLVDDPKYWHPVYKNHRSNDVQIYVTENQAMIRLVAFGNDVTASVSAED
jgi:hypothetical protein